MREVQRHVIHQAVHPSLFPEPHPEPALVALLAAVLLLHVEANTFLLLIPLVVVILVPIGCRLGAECLEGALGRENSLLVAILICVDLFFFAVIGAFL